MSAMLTTFWVLLGIPALFLIIGLGADLVLRRPKLLVAGGGGGSLHIGNKATIWGLQVARETCEVAGAWLIEDRTGETVGTNLHFLQPIGGWGHTVNISAGATVELRLFSVWPDGDYAMYLPVHEKAPATKPPRPFTAESARFTLLIRDKIGRVHRFRLVVKSRRNGLEIRYPWTPETRISMFIRGLQKAARAFTRTPQP